jgi:hypothetical protein
MAAPAAPHIWAHGNASGDYIIVRWQPVPNATDYNLYVDAEGVSGIDLQVDESDVNTDGWFHVHTSPQLGATNVWVTALNVSAEESAESNHKQVNLRGPSPSFPDDAAVSHVRGDWR